jgi:hypothetical protein
MSDTLTTVHNDAEETESAPEPSDHDAILAAALLPLLRAQMDAYWGTMRW